MPGKGTGRQIIPEPTVSTPTPLQGSWGIELGKLLRAAAQHVSASSGCAIPCCGTLGKSLNFPEPQLLPTSWQVVITEQTQCLAYRRHAEAVNSIPNFNASNLAVGDKRFSVLSFLTNLSPMAPPGTWIMVPG